MATSMRRQNDFAAKGVGDGMAGIPTLHGGRAREPGVRISGLRLADEPISLPTPTPKTDRTTSLVRRRTDAAQATRIAKSTTEAWNEDEGRGNVSRRFVLLILCMGQPRLRRPQRFVQRGYDKGGAVRAQSRQVRVSLSRPRAGAVRHVPTSQDHMRR